jgi:hypothetical protein
MVMGEIQVRQIIARFKSSVAADLYSSTDIVDFEAAETAVKKYDPEISALDTLRSRGALWTDGLSEVLLAHPGLYGLLCSLLSITDSFEFEDGGILPAPNAPPRTPTQAQTTAKHPGGAGFT